MVTVILIGFCFGLLFLEALTDAFEHRLKKTGKVIFGDLYHATNLLMILFAVLFGYVYGNYALLWSKETLMLIVAYTLIRFGFFNVIFNTLADYSSKYGVGRTDITDRIIGFVLGWVDSKLNFRIPIVVFNVIKLIAAFGGCIIIARNFDF